MKTKDKISLTVGTIALIATGAGVGWVMFGGGDDAETVTTTSSSSSKTSTSSGTTSTSTNTASTSYTSSSSTSSSSSSYKDGTYTASANYSVPKGDSNTITATVEVSGGKIVSVTTTNDYTDHESKSYISRFESSLSGSATGQSLADYSPSRIGGASLTTAGFNDVLDAIRSDAAA